MLSRRRLYGKRDCAVYSNGPGCSNNYHKDDKDELIDVFSYNHVLHRCAAIRCNCPGVIS
jgi:hypothetical protein